MKRTPISRCVARSIRRLEKNPVGVAVDQQRQHHPGVILRRAGAAMVHLEGAQIDAFDRLDHEMRQIIRRDPVPQIGRKQKRLVPITVHEVAHPAILREIQPKVRQTARVLFRIAIEEGEAWLLGDRGAVKTAYPHAKDAVLDGMYRIAYAVPGKYLPMLFTKVGPGGLETLGYPEIGKAKCRWAAEIGRHMDIHRNQSKSLQVFRDGLQGLT